MSRKIYLYFDLLPLIVLSFLGLFIFVILVFSPPVNYEYFLFRKTIVGSVFGLICILGIVAVLSPKECSKIFYYRKERSSLDKKYISQENWFSNNTSLILGLKIMHGHHPGCEKFSSHEFRIKDKTFCAGCTGLLLGALISLFGTFIYFSNNLYISPFFISIGLLGVALGLLLPLINLQRTILRLSLNAFFIFGIFLILIGIDTIVQSVFIDLLLISFSIFWLFTRISLSQWNHQRICHECGKKCGFDKIV
ncbi:MAG: hypothetical protein H3Z53_06305 [archaeon]|nr:hypothetical protein [archaeon]MCP8313968.1 hypothetical protein [archaeon]